MPGFYFPDLQMFFIHIPKNGGNSVFNAFNEMGDISRFFPTKNGPEKMRWHTSASWVRAQNPDLWDSSYSFTFVRNPWDRIVSLWNHVMEDRNMFCYIYNIDRDNDEDYIRLLAEEKEKTFSEWLLTYNIPFVFRKGHQVGNPKLLPVTKTDQMNWVNDYSGQQLVNEVFKLEDMVQFISKMKENYGINLDVGFWNKRRKPEYWNFYTPEAKALVDHYFAECINLYRYRY